MSGSRTLTGLWTQAIADWARSLKAGSRSVETITLRTYHLRRLAAAHPHVDPWDVTLDELVAWMASHTEWRQSTRRSYRTSIRVFYSWAHRTGRCASNPAALLEGVTPPPAKPRPAPEHVFRGAVSSARDPRVRLMLQLAGHEGMRRGEISRVHTRDLEYDDVDQAWNLRVHGKGGKTRIVPLNDEVARELRRLPAGWAFPGAIDGHLSPAHVGKLMSRALEDGYTAHTLRHRCASRLYDAERDIRAVQEVLGHASVRTTQIYTQVPQGALRAAIRAAA